MINIGLSCAYSRCVYACEYVVTNTFIRGSSKSYNYYTLTLMGFNMKLRGRLNFFFPGKYVQIIIKIGITIWINTIFLLQKNA